tara:strand:+ start:500 stop:1030 length:531 start_codon:yes stop_codon:yes gene_type:complete
MALPLASAGLRVAMAIAKRAGKKLVKKGSKGYKLKKTKHSFESNISTDFKKYATPIPKRRTFAQIPRKRFFKGPVGGIGRGLKREVKRSYFRGKGQIRHTLTTGEPFKGIAKGTKKHLKFYSKIISPEGKQFRYLVKRPTFGDFGVVATKGRKIRKNVLKGGIYGAYGYGAYKMKS